MKYIGKKVMWQPIVGDITYTHSQSSASETWTVHITYIESRQ